MGYPLSQNTKFKLLAWSIGLLYLWFGLLKFFPDLSPAEELAKQTIDQLTFGIIPPHVSIKLLALWETVIGIGLLSGMLRTFIIRIALVHMILTFAPLFLLPDLSFSYAPYGFTLVGQYIMKNLAIIAALLLLRTEQNR